MKSKLAWGLLLLIIWSLFVRIVVFADFPRGVFYSNATLNWRVFNLVDNGHDEFGRPFPILFANWQDFESPVLTYLLYGIRLIDKNEYISLTLIASLIGTLFLVGLYFFVSAYFENKRLGLTVAIIASISPWLIIFSRFLNSELLALTLVVWGLYFMVSKKTILGVLVVFLGAISSKELFIASLGIPVVVWIITKNKKISTVIFLLMIGIVSIFGSSPGFMQSIKDNQLSLFFNNTFLDNMNILRGQYIKQQLPHIMGTIFFNKSQLVIVALRHFFEALSLPFLFSNRVILPRQTVFNFGPFFMIWMPFFLYGVYMVFKRKLNQKNMLLAFLCLGALPCIFIVNSFDVTKSLYIFISVLIFIGIGVNASSRKINVIFWIISLISFAFFSYQALLLPQSGWNSTTIELVDAIKTRIEGKNLVYLPTHDPIRTIWLTDRIDPNPGPVIADMMKIHYTESNLNQGKLVYKGWISKIGELSIGNVDQLKTNPGQFDIVIISKNEKDWFKCPTELFSVGSGDQTYYVYERCTQK